MQKPKGCMQCNTTLCFDYTNPFHAPQSALHTIIAILFLPPFLFQLSSKEQTFIPSLPLERFDFGCLFICSSLLTSTLSAVIKNFFSFFLILIQRDIVLSKAIPCPCVDSNEIIHYLTSKCLPLTCELECNIDLVSVFVKKGQ